MAALPQCHRQSGTGLPAAPEIQAVLPANPGVDTVFSRRIRKVVVNDGHTRFLGGRRGEGLGFQLHVLQQSAGLAPIAQNKELRFVPVQLNPEK